MIHKKIIIESWLRETSRISEFSRQKFSLRFPGLPGAPWNIYGEIFLRFSLLKSRIVGLIEKVMGSGHSGPKEETLKEAFLAGKLVLFDPGWFLNFLFNRLKHLMTFSRPIRGFSWKNRKSSPFPEPTPETQPDKYSKKKKHNVKLVHWKAWNDMQCWIK